MISVRQHAPLASGRFTLRDALARARTEIRLGKLDAAEELLEVITTAYPLAREGWLLSRDLHAKRGQHGRVEVIDAFLVGDDVPWR